MRIDDYVKVERRPGGVALMVDAPVPAIGVVLTNEEAQRAGDALAMLAGANAAQESKMIKEAA